ncbi:ABC transporter permease [Elongatibacter sediminis]|uniref:Transport permease protein n=1 Tax=Elongatibacter sediminis TaxID=3119006 RepID=A0AAW9RNB6_9GAMM
MKRLAHPIFWQLVSRSIRKDYLENLTGFAWLILQPLMLLSVYAFVFSTIFKARVPDSLDVGFVAYLAVAFWPWTAFSEAVLKAGGTVRANAALIGKVAFPSELLPLSMVVATFLMNMAGYAAVLVVLSLTGTDIHWLGVVAMLPVLVLLAVLAGAIGLVMSALQVFVRDVAQILPPLMTFWFFTTPILYSPTYLPDRLAEVIAWNPMAWFVGFVRAAALQGELHPGLAGIAIAVSALLLFWLGLRFFRRLSGHFEDFL